MNMLTAAWEKVPETTIQKCFENAGISTDSQEAAIYNEDDFFKELNEELDNLQRALGFASPQRWKCDWVRWWTLDI